MFSTAYMVLQKINFPEARAKYVCDFIDVCKDLNTERTDSNIKYTHRHDCGHMAIKILNRMLIAIKDGKYDEVLNHFPDFPDTRSESFKLLSPKRFTIAESMETMKVYCDADTDISEQGYVERFIAGYDVATQYIKHAVREYIQRTGAISPVKFLG